MTNRVTVAEFQAQAAELLTQVQASGEAVVIMQEGRPLVEMKRSDGGGVPTGEERQRRREALRGSVIVHGDIIAPISKEEDWELD